MKHLKETLQQRRQNATAMQLLAVQLAELGLFERAISGMKAALSMEPGLEIARFQLGVLLLDRNCRSEARGHFSSLSDGSLDYVLRRYSEAMIALCDDNLAVAQEKLALGLSQESANPALPALMRRLLDRVSQSDEATVSKSDAHSNQSFPGVYRHTSS